MYRVDKVMIEPSRTFRIFVSSTFADLEQERNALHEHVFPHLRELCLAHGARFQAIDLRWGVSEEAAIDQQTLKICLDEIERCQKTTPRPNFVVLLGDRYGWRPLPAEIPIHEFEAIHRRLEDGDEEKQRHLSLLDHWYVLDKNASPPVYCLMPRKGEFKDYKEWQRVEQDLRTMLHESISGLTLTPEQRMKYETSATEQEILQGALGILDAKEHVFCFFRKIEGGLAAQDYVELNHEAHARLEILKDKLERLLPGNIHHYWVAWTDKGITTDHISNLCNDVYNSLSQVILQEIAKLEKTDALSREIAICCLSFS
jgi:hypothetical protein